MLTAAQDKENIGQAFNNGAVDYISKPIVVEELQARIKNQINLIKAQQKMKESEVKFRSISENATDAIVMINAQGEVTFWNNAATQLFGYTEREVLLKDIHKLVAPFIPESQYRKGLARFHETGEGAVIGKVISVDAQPKEGDRIPVELAISAIHIKQEWHAVAIIRDVTLRKQMEMAVRDSELNRVVSEILLLTLKDLSLDDFLENALDVITSSSMVGFSGKGSIFLVEKQTNGEPILVLKTQKQLAGPLRELCARVPFGKCLCGKAAETKKLVYSPCLDEDHDITFPGIEPHGHYCMPVISRGELLGVINVYVGHDHKRRAEEKVLLQYVADNLASVIDRHRVEAERIEASRMEEELSTAQLAQDTLFPHPYIARPTFSLMAHYERAAECGGDWLNYYYFEKDNRLLLIIADVMGHGAAAAMVTAIIKGCTDAIIRLCESGGSDKLGPDFLMEYYNESLINAFKDQISMTAFVGIMDLATGELNYSSAGHPFGIVYQQNDPNDQNSLDYNLLKGKGPLVGVVPEVTFPVHRTILKPNTYLFLYTDGFIENPNNKGRPFGKRRLSKLIESNVKQERRTPELSKNIMEDYYNYLDGEPIEDDVALLIFNYQAG